MKRPAVQSGLDVLVSGSLRSLASARVGILCHQASVDSRLRSVIDLLRARNVNVQALFAPEHGFWGTAQDQIPIHAQRHPILKIPVYSLYGDHRAPSEADLKEIDVLVCDLQDVGSRYYTFIWTMALALQVCAKAGKKFIVLDRPNPLNGLTLEGPVLDPEFASFVGLYPIPVRHGMTIGEIAQWVNHGLGVEGDLEVVPMKGWKRRMDFEETGLPWVYPSPNMPTPDTAFVYPGMCLIEGTNLSEGRGTTRPFELVGAPYIPAESLAGLLNRDRLPGVSFRSCQFEPTFHKFKEEVCGGVQLHVIDRKIFKPFLTGLQLIQQIYNLCPQRFAWRDPPYEYEAIKLPIDILCGTDEIRKTIETGTPVQTLEASWNAQCRSFEKDRRPFLLYN